MLAGQLSPSSWNGQVQAGDVGLVGNSAWSQVVQEKAASLRSHLAKHPRSHLPSGEPFQAPTHGFLTFFFNCKMFRWAPNVLPTSPLSGSFLLGPINRIQSDISQFSVLFLGGHWGPDCHPPHHPRASRKERSPGTWTDTSPFLPAGTSSRVRRLEWSWAPLPPALLTPGPSATV